MYKSYFYFIVDANFEGHNTVESSFSLVKQDP